MSPTRAFGRGGTIYNPWHYVPVLARKPGALRNGAPFKHWVRDAIANAITTLPEQLRRSLTWDQGAEMAKHSDLRLDIGWRSRRCPRTSAPPSRGIWPRST